MRSVAYSVATIAAIAIMIAVASMPPSSDDPVSASSVMDVSASPELMSTAGSMVVNVPNMHCEFACFPRVKDTLEGTRGVNGVELAEQQKEGTIDNRQVIVNYDAGFDITAALASLADEGFTKAEVVQ